MGFFQVIDNQRKTVDSELEDVDALEDGEKEKFVAGNGFTADLVRVMKRIFSDLESIILFALSWT